MAENLIETVERVETPPPLPENDDPVTAAPEPPKKRGRKPGTASKSKTSTRADSLTLTLGCVNAMLYGATKNPFFNVPQEQNRQLGQAVANVLRHYPDFETSEKIADWINLGIVFSMVYLAPTLMRHGDIPLPEDD